MPYKIHFECKSMILIFIIVFQIPSTSKNALNTPQIFHCYWVICCTISVIDAKIACSFVVDRKFNHVISNIWL